MDKFVLGIDFGTDSCRTLVVNAMTGAIVSSAVCEFTRWKEQRFCRSDLMQYRQHPLDHIESLTQSIVAAVSKLSAEQKEAIVAIGIDATGSTPGPVNKDGVQLALLPEFANEPDAMFILWKDHTATAESVEITASAKKQSQDYTRFCGGTYSAEWFWAKILHITRKNKKVREAAYTWVEHSDWLPALLTDTIKPDSLIRNRCAAGHKGLWHESFPNGYPPEEFFYAFDPDLPRILKTLSPPRSVDSVIGNLSKEWAERLGLSQNIVVATGIIDAHCGAIGAGISVNTMVKVMGTSTCDMVLADPSAVKDKTVHGISGQVDGSVLPHYIGFEAGQSSFGDIYAWYEKLLSWPLYFFKNEITIKTGTLSLLSALDKEAAKLPVTENTDYAVDWFNGRRTPDANQRVCAGVGGLSLASDTVSVYYALAESSVFGSYAILNRFEEEGIPIKAVIGTGGIARKSPFIMQLMADCFNRNISVTKEMQTVALGAAIIAAAAGKIYENIEQAQKALLRGYDSVYTPNQTRHEILKKRWKKYTAFASFLNTMEKN
ncbi:ribulokinase [Treponema phagedenis]|uniref:Ribulokinase n=1 Tax=Treponema phagedenis TaxID=162 RepID=A0A0B7GTH9_TREPH|nr:ribulokinase [Treponema phagedenis]NVP23849.1 ribulokinase [Treponema phagedenis]QEJ96341.1 ribulokinase [Treponema phagedenis]QEJ99500.1 ribulokinase [Treponema phagedenis]QEK02139.1 ribulokinase [Treponema phagedenis]QEK05071.1 ribulokinase [Treponema phagedenis]